jgi:putative membrane protein
MSDEWAAHPATLFVGRLHPLTMLFGVWNGARNTWPLIPLLVFGNRWLGLLLFALTLGGAVVVAALRYFSFSYRIEHGELITKQGILSRSERHIPLERIQEIRLEQHLLHRLFGVVDAQVETASGKGAEATLSVLSQVEAESLRVAVFQRAPVKTSSGQLQPVAELPELHLVRRLSLGELALAGLTSNHLVSALAIAGLVWQFGHEMLPRAMRVRVQSFFTQTLLGWLAQGTLSVVWFWLVVVTLLLLIGMVFSVAGSIVRFFDFTLTQQGDGLQRRYGLLTRHSSNLPRQRIQVLKVEENLLRRVFKLAAISADVSGGQHEESAAGQGRDVLIPLLKRTECDGLLATFLPDLHAPTSWQPVSPRAIRRGTLKSAVLLGLLTAALVAWQPNWFSLWPLLLVPVAYFMHRASYRQLGYARTAHHFFTRAGWLGRALLIVPINKIQGVTITQTPFDRRLGLAGLSVDTAGRAYTGGGPAIRNLPLAEAEALARALSQQAGLTPYRG